MRLAILLYTYHIFILHPFSERSGWISDSMRDMCSMLQALSFSRAALDSELVRYGMAKGIDLLISPSKVKF